MKPTHPSVLVPDAQEVAIWEVQDDTWVGGHRQGLMEVAGPYFLDGSAFNPEIVELRRAGWCFAVSEPPEPSTQAVEPTCEPKLLIGRFGCITGDHTVPRAEHISLLRAAQHATRFWKDDGSVLCFVSACQLVVDSCWKRGMQYCCGAQHCFADIWRQVFSMLDKKFGSRWRVQKVAAHQSRAEVDSGCLSHYAWSGNSKADEMARSDAARFAMYSSEPNDS